METVDFTKGEGTVIATFSDETVEEFRQKYKVDIANDNSISVICRIDVNRVVYKFIDFSDIKFAGEPVANRAELEDKIDEYFFGIEAGTGGGGGSSVGASDDKHIKILQGLGSDLFAQGAAYITSTSANLFLSTLQIQPFYLPVAGTIHGFQMCTGNNGGAVLNVTTQENRVGVYTYNNATGLLTLVASSANDKTIWEKAAGIHFRVPLSTAYPAAAGVYYFATLSSWGSITGTSSLNLGLQFMNGTNNNGADLFMLPNSGKMYATKGSITALPTSINISTFLTATQGWWFGIY